MNRVFFMAPSWSEGAILSSFSWSEKRQAGHWASETRRRSPPDPVDLARIPARLLGSGLFSFKKRDRIIERKPEDTRILADGRSRHYRKDVVVGLARNALTVTLQQFPEVSLFGTWRKALKHLEDAVLTPIVANAITSRPEACASVE